jgi:hypothetical protein
MLCFKQLSTGAAFVLLCCDVNRQCQVMSELCVEPLGMESSQMPLLLDFCCVFIEKEVQSFKGTVSKMEQAKRRLIR